MNCSLPCFHSMQRRLNGEKIQTTQEKPRDVPLTLKASHELPKHQNSRYAIRLQKPPPEMRKFATLTSDMKVFNMF